ncbi:MAG: LysR family transcriptional regulator [Pseudomonadota bacterium]
MRLENSELRAFRAVIQEGGFKRAAGALHISQSAVSQAVASLEEKLEARLIQRGKSLRLTTIGKRLFQHAVEVLQGETQALEDITLIKQGNAETLNLGLSATINRFYAPDLISAYYQDNPQTRLKLAELPGRNIIAAVLTGSCELGLGPFQKQMSSFQTVPLYSDSRHLVVSPKHRYYSRMLMADERVLRQTPLITSALDNPEMRPSIARIRDQFSTVWEVSSLSLRIHMVVQGMGVTFMDRKLLNEHPGCAQLHVMDDVSFGTIAKQVGLYYRADRQLSRGASKFVALCKRYWNL